MDMLNSTALILPGIGGSDSDHWQSRWEAQNPSFTRVLQSDWQHPVCKRWMDTLENAVLTAGSDPILIAHSMGCLLVAHWAGNTRTRIKGAMLVAPPDPDAPGFPDQAVGFSPLPRLSFPFPSIVVASSNDPYGSVEFASAAAAAWGSRFFNIGPAGHINSDSGLGDWPEGFALLRQLTG